MRDPCLYLYTPHVLGNHQVLERVRVLLQTLYCVTTCLYFLST